MPAAAVVPSFRLDNRTAGWRYTFTGGLAKRNVDIEVGELHRSEEGHVVNLCRRFVFPVVLALVAFLPSCQCDEAVSESVAPDFQISGSPPWVTASGGQVSVNFGDVLVGQTKSVELTISNKGDFVLKVTKAELGSGTSTEFAYNMAVPIELDPQKESVISLAYTPTAPGPDEGSVVLTTNVAEGKQYTIGLRGNGVQPDIEVCTAEPAACNDDNTVQLGLDFGEAALGGEAGPRQVTVKNAGGYALNVLDAVVLSCPWDKADCSFDEMAAPSEPEYALNPASISGEYPPGRTTAVGVTFKPFSGGGVKSALRISSDDADELDVWVVLHGKGIAPKLCPQPPVYLEFGSVTVGSFVDKEFTFTSCGTQLLTVNTIAFAPSNTAEFSWTDGTAPEAPVALDPGGSMTLRIRYLPADVGEDLGRVEIESSDPNAPKGYVDLHGEGTGEPTCSLSVSPTTLNFGRVLMGKTATKNVSLANIGDAACTVSGITRLSGTDKNEFSIDPALRFPLTVGPGAGAEAAFSYKPADAGADTSKWRVESNDPGHPRVDVDLTGSAASASGCNLQVSPQALSFGLVSLGQSKTLSFTATNAGLGICFVDSVTLDSTSSRSFQIGRIDGLSTQKTMGPFEKFTVEVVYSPQVAQTESGAAVVNILSSSVSVLAASVSLSGGGIGPRLCVNPKNVDFGIVTIGAAVDRKAEVSNCGTADLSVNSVAFEAGASADFSFSGPLPAGTFRPGDKGEFTVTYQPSDEGEDKGGVAVASTDPIGPVTLVSLLGYGANDTTLCGNVTGRVCSPGGEIWLGGATVSAGGRQTTTDADGYFTLTCVPVGQQTVHIASGSFSTDVSVLVENRKTADVQSQCVQGSAKIAVGWGRWDSAQVILDRLRLPYDMYTDPNDSSAPKGYPSAEVLLTDRSVLSKYDIVILNCGISENRVDDPAVIANLQDFVAGGGSLFVSDWAYDFIERAWPGAVDYYGDDTQLSAAQSGGSGFTAGPIQADIVDPNLVSVMGINKVPLLFCCVTIDSADAATTVHIQGDVYRDSSEHPMVVSFVPFPNGGRVLFTIFHNADQNARDIDRMFYYMLFQL